MKRLMLSGLIFAALIAVATGAMRSHSRSVGGAVAGAGTQSPLGIAGSTPTSSLPVEDFDDRSLVFPRETGR